MGSREDICLRISMHRVYVGKTYVHSLNKKLPGPRRRLRGGIGKEGNTGKLVVRSSGGGTKVGSGGSGKVS